MMSKTSSVSSEPADNLIDLETSANNGNENAESFKKRVA